MTVYPSAHGKVCVFNPPACEACGWTHGSLVMWRRWAVRTAWPAPASGLSDCRGRNRTGASLLRSGSICLTS